MEATFFISRSEQACGVTCIDDLPVEPAAEPLVIGSPGLLMALAKLLGTDGEGAISPLRDATCRSFPVWSYGPAAAAAITKLSDEAIDDLAKQLSEDPSADGMDADLHELATLMTDLREALRSSHDVTGRLFVLLEEKAL